MKVAIVHDSLSESGGAERVLAELIKIFPQAEIFTSFYEKRVVNKISPLLRRGFNLHAFWFQHFPRKTTTIIQLLSPLIWRFQKLSKFDLVITSSAYYLSNMVKIDSDVPAIHYIHSLPKNLFDLERKSSAQKYLPFSLHKNLYINSLRKSGNLITNSRHMKKIIYKTAGLKSTVIYPPVDIPNLPPVKNTGKYYLIISRIDDTKSLELAISASNRLNFPLIMAGEANCQKYLKKLKKIAGNQVKFLGFISEKKRKQLYKNAIAFLFCSKNEDFGITPVEAMAHGVPVITFYGGGVKETITHKKTGYFFFKHSPQSLIKAIKQFENIKFDTKILYKHTKKFSQERFRMEMESYIGDVICAPKSSNR